MKPLKTLKTLKTLKHSREMMLTAPTERTRAVLATWQRISDTYRLPEAVVRSVFQSARQIEVDGADGADRADAEDVADRESSARRLCEEHRIGTAQLIAAGCLIPDTLTVTPSARKYRPAPNADHLLTMAIAAALSPRELGDHPGDYRGDHLGEITEIPSRYFEIQTARPRPKGVEIVEIGGHYGA